ncbi:MAG TPA: glycosyltransferase family 4 protein [Terriglobia bacterium]|nr:glycosyltransferase family 4 protein [Terriglobia bacterium]
MKIAMIGSRGIGSNYGGIERVLDELCPRLAMLGHEIDVFSRTDIGLPEPANEVAADEERGEAMPAPELLAVKSIPTRSFGGKHLENLSRSMASTFKALRRYDLVHFHATGPGLFSAVTRAAGQRSVVTIHALDQRRQKWGPAARLSLQLAERTITSCADEITVVSESLRRYMREKYDYHARYIPNGIPRRAAVAPGPLLAKHQLEAGRYFLFASRLTPEKGCHDLIAAFNRSTTPFKLAVAGGVGPTEYAAQLKRVADPERVVFLGHLGGTELAEAFSNAYVFVLPSYIEGMSMALLEAISFGIPALVSDIEENLLVLGGQGFHFPVGNVAALEAVLALLASKPTLVHAEARALKSLPLPTWDDIAIRYDRFYRNIRDTTAREH